MQILELNIRFVAHKAVTKDNGDGAGANEGEANPRFHLQSGCIAAKRAQAANG